MEYAQARMQARHGARPDEAQWRQLGEHRELAAYIAAVRATQLADWIAGIDDRSGLHEIERVLRRHWRQTVGELVRWLPPEWHAAVHWTAQLVDLPALSHLARGGTMPQWLKEDAGFSLDAGASADVRAWVVGWVRRWPDDQEDETQTLRALAERVEFHLKHFAGLDAARAWEARLAFRLDMVRAFRRLAFRPGAAFVHLLLHALDLERLRGELVIRALQRRCAP
jgi:hypothetical protein